MSFRVQCSALTREIYAGTARDAMWMEKNIVTLEACVAVAQHVVDRHGGAMTLRAQDGSGWDIEVTEIKP